MPSVDPTLHNAQYKLMRPGRLVVLSKEYRRIATEGQLFQCSGYWNVPKGVCLRRLPSTESAGVLIDT